MKKDGGDGVVKQAKGAARTASGDLVGDAKLKHNGKVDSAVGKFQNVVGGAKQAAQIK